MSKTSAVEDLFFAALEKGTESERTAFLDSACGDDAKLSREIEILLKAHPKAGSFLNKPITDQLAASGDRPDANLVLDSSPDTRSAAGQNGSAPAKGDGSDGDDGLDFLQPSSRPDSLGRLGHYEILQVLGKGGFSVVFRAFDNVLQRVVAIKALNKQVAATSPARKRFLREARSSAKVRHENVVQVHAVEEQPLPYLVMEFIPGETLQQRFDRSGPIEPREAARIGRQIAEGLAAAHDTGLIHRDIKPGNILIEDGPQERVKITDFGMARAADASITQSGMIADTPMFMAPEQALGGKTRPPGGLVQPRKRPLHHIAPADHRSGPMARSQCSSEWSRTRRDRSPK
ncbi:serine/threonine-protein kinase [Zavarzinella formosa]|uniref:serine/threonine-protein kinase n=1 Tax=Zavarzinella formosa TaxID=360055 RepID=UPI000301ECB1|nr:serine/threonine-protein kinase [Zavarzinella formosa]